MAKLSCKQSLYSNTSIAVCGNKKEKGEESKAGHNDMRSTMARQMEAGSSEKQPCLRSGVYILLFHYVHTGAQWHTVAGCRAGHSGKLRRTEKYSDWWLKGGCSLISLLLVIWIQWCGMLNGNDRHKNAYRRALDSYIKIKLKYCNTNQ